MPRSRIAACLLLGLAALPAWAAPPARAATLLLPVESARDEYAETFTFVADLDDGSYVQLQLAITNIGPGAGTGLCRALVKRPGEAAWTSHARVGRAGWRHQAGDDGEALTIGPCSVRSGDRTTVRAATPGIVPEGGWTHARTHRLRRSRHVDGRTLPWERNALEFLRDRAGRSGGAARLRRRERRSRGARGAGAQRLGDPSAHR